jgi:creatinine amidohydrolase
VEEYLKRSQGVIVPVGSTEQHGPTGLLGTDFICAQTIARMVGERTGALVGPTIPIGMSVHHMAFPGSMTFRPTTLILVVRDYVLSLARHGFNRFFFINGHGGNTPSLRAAFSEVSDELARIGSAREVRCRAVSWWETASSARISEELFHGRDGGHATAGEISITRAAFPDITKQAEFDPTPPPDVGFYGPADFRRRYPDGRIGSDPSLASRENGERILDEVVPELAGKYVEFLEEK